MTDEDEKLTRRYRELAREEPPGAVDAAILAAAHRAVKSRPVSQRWMGPLSIAAVLVLGIGVTLNLQRESPGVEVAAPQIEYPVAPSVAPEATPVPAPSAEPLQRREEAARSSADTVAEKEAPKRALKKEAATMAAPPAELRAQPQAFAGAPVPPAPSALAPPPARAAGVESVPQAAPAERGSTLAAARARREMADNAVAPQQQADPAAELERIAALRTAGRHAEADKALEEFRRRFPAYRIPDPVWDRVRAR